MTYTYEVKQWVWDFHAQEGPIQSLRHLFEPDQLIGLTFQFDEAENPRVAREMQPRTTSMEGAYYDNSFGSDFVTVATPTSVNATTWGRIKATFRR